MSVIHHYEVQPYRSLDQQQHMVSLGTKALSAKLRNGTIALYVEKPSVTDGVQYSILQMFYVGTGHTFDSNGYQFIDTIQDGAFYWHVYARIT